MPTMFKTPYEPRLTPTGGANVFNTDGEYIAYFNFAEDAEFFCLAANERAKLKDEIRNLEKKLHIAKAGLDSVKDLRDLSDYGLGNVEILVQNSLSKIEENEK